MRRGTSVQEEERQGTKLENKHELGESLRTKRTCASSLSKTAHHFPDDLTGLANVCGFSLLLSTLSPCLCS